MSETVLDGMRWKDVIGQSESLKRILRNSDFLRKQIRNAFSRYKGADALDPIRLFKTIENTLELEDEIRDAIGAVTNGSTEFKSLLHWFSFLVYLKARELNLMFVRGTAEGDRNE